MFGKGSKLSLIDYIVLLLFLYISSLVEFQKLVSCIRRFGRLHRSWLGSGSWVEVEFQSCIERRSAPGALVVLILACLLALGAVMGGMAMFRWVLRLLAVKGVFRFVIICCRLV